LDRVSVISNLPEGVYKILWEEAGRYPCWWRQDEVEDSGGCILVVDGRGDHRGTDEFV